MAEYDQVPPNEIHKAATWSGHCSLTWCYLLDFASKSKNFAAQVLHVALIKGTTNPAPPFFLCDFIHISTLVTRPAPRRWHCFTLTLYMFNSAWLYQQSSCRGTGVHRLFVCKHVFTFSQKPSIKRINNKKKMWKGSYLPYLKTIFSSACVYTGQLLSWHGCLLSIHPSLNSSFSETAAWIQTKFYGKLLIHHISRPFYFFHIFFRFHQHRTLWEPNLPPTSHSWIFLHFSWFFVSNILTKLLFRNFEILRSWILTFFFFWFSLTWDHMAEKKRCSFHKSLPNLFKLFWFFLSSTSP